MKNNANETTMCAKCGKELHEGGRVYFNGEDYHEDCFNAEHNQDYFTTRGGFYR